MYVIPLCTMVVVAVLFAASFTVEGDMRALQRWMDEPAAPLSLTPTPLEQSSD
jgi:ABC-type iron transport system FetAB permease component